MVGMGRLIDLDDLLDATDVAEALGLASSNAVATYGGRYEDFPSPVWESRGHRCKLWLRSDVTAWAAERQAR